jgi:hypothetical protein
MNTENNYTSLLTIVEDRPKFKKFLSLGSVALLATGFGAAIAQTYGYDSQLPYTTLLGGLCLQLSISNEKPSFLRTLAFTAIGASYIASNSANLSHPLMAQAGMITCTTAITMLAQHIKIKNR